MASCFTLRFIKVSRLAERPRQPLAKCCGSLHDSALYIRIIDAYYKNNINPILMLPRIVRLLLATCPKYDAYVEKDIHTKQPVGFRLYFPVSSVIHDIKNHV